MWDRDMHMSVDAQGGQHRALDSLELALQVVGCESLCVGAGI